MGRGMVSLTSGPRVFSGFIIHHVGLFLIPEATDAAQKSVWILKYVVLVPKHGFILL